MIGTRFDLYSPFDPFHWTDWKEDNAGISIVVQQEGQVRQVTPARAWVHDEIPYLAVTQWKDTHNYVVTHTPTGYQAGVVFEYGTIRKAKRACVALSTSIDFSVASPDKQFSERDMHMARRIENAIACDSNDMMDYLA